MKKALLALAALGMATSAAAATGDPFVDETATLRLDGEGQLWCDVRGGRVPARFESDAANQLADQFVEDDQGIALRIGDALVHPPQVEDPLAGWDPSKGHVES